MEALAKLGIDPAVMLAQAVNFFLLLGILTYFVYKPLMRVLDERKDRIAKADENAKRIEAELKKAESKTAEALAEAKSEAHKIIANAKKTAKELEVKLVADAKAKVEKVVAEGRAELKKEQEAAANAIQSEVAKIVLLATEKLLGREVTGKDHERETKEAIKLLGNFK